MFLVAIQTICIHCYASSEVLLLIIFIGSTDSCWLVNFEEEHPLRRWNT